METCNRKITLTSSQRERRLFWHRQGNHTTVRCSVQMTTTRSNSATSASSMECSTGSFKTAENRDGCADLIVGVKAHQLVSLNGEFSRKSVLLLILLPHKYRIILIDQIAFTVSIITSAFKHQWPFVCHVEVRELPTIYSNQEETDTRMVLYLHRAAALAWIQERNSQNP